MSKFALTSFITAATIACLGQSPAHAEAIPGVAPEVAACVWEEGDNEVACVSVNGKELLAFRGGLYDCTAAEKAETLAERLGIILGRDKFDPEKLVPAKVDGQAVLKLGGETVLSLEPDDFTALEKDSFKASWKLANAMRTALGAPPLSESFLTAPEGLQGAVTSIGSDVEVVDSFSGKASWYGKRFHGRRCSDGSRFDMNKLTAAHRKLPFGTKLLVKNRKTGDSCIVEVTDRGPYHGNRVLDLSKAAANKINMLRSGVAMVDCFILGNCGK